MKLKITSLSVRREDIRCGASGAGDPQARLARLLEGPAGLRANDNAHKLREAADPLLTNKRR